MRRERGQPPKLDAGRRRTVLDAVASGATLAAAAAKAGVTRATVGNTADRDPRFARDLAEARRMGEGARLRAAGKPVCPACERAVLAFDVAGPGTPRVACTGCPAVYRLTPAVTGLPVAACPSVYEISTDLASRPLADTA